MLFVTWRPAWVFGNLDLRLEATWSEFWYGPNTAVNRTRYTNNSGGSLGARRRIVKRGLRRLRCLLPSALAQGLRRASDITHVLLPQLSSSSRTTCSGGAQ